MRKSIFLQVMLLSRKLGKITVWFWVSTNLSKFGFSLDHCSILFYYQLANIDSYLKIRPKLCFCYFLVGTANASGMIFILKLVKNGAFERFLGVIFILN